MSCMSLRFFPSVLHPFHLSVLHSIFPSELYSSVSILSSSLSNLLLKPSVEALISVTAFFGFLDSFFRFQFSAENFHLSTNFFITFISYY